MKILVNKIFYLKFGVAFSVFLFLTCCQTTNKGKYNYLNYTDKEITPIPLSMGEDNEDSDLDGKVNFSINGELLESGKFDNGYKVGFCKYHKLDKSILWVQSKIDDKTLTTFPGDWKKHSDTNFVYAFLPKTNGKHVDSKFLCLLRPTIGSKHRFLDHVKENVSRSRSLGNVTNYSCYKIVQDSDTFFLNKYIKRIEEEEITVLSFLFFRNEKYYELVYSDANEVLVENYLIFIEHIRNTKIEGEKILPYFSSSFELFSITPENYNDPLNF